MQDQLNNLLGKEVVVYSSQHSNLSGILESDNESWYGIEGEITLFEFWVESISRIVDNKIYLLDYDLQWVDGL